MYELTVDYDAPGIGHTYWLFTPGDGAKAFGAFFDQVTAFMRFDRVHIKLVRGKDIIAEYKINSHVQTNN